MNRIKIQKLIDSHREEIKEASDERHRRFVEFARKAREGCKGKDSEGEIKEFEKSFQKLVGRCKPSKEYLKELEKKYLGK